MQFFPNHRLLNLGIVILDLVQAGKLNSRRPTTTLTPGSYLAGLPTLWAMGLRSRPRKSVSSPRKTGCS